MKHPQDSHPFISTVLAILLIGFATAASVAFGGPTKIGNGDDGSDLEGFVEVQSGPLLEARDEAVKMAKSLNLSGAHGLGMLLPELQGTKIYLTKKDAAAVEGTDGGVFHSDMKSRVYARTLAEPHAATRFFPVAEKLDRDQLVALHFHEALHRALPASVRENESVVSTITLSITSPGASFDGVNRVAMSSIPQTPIQQSAQLEAYPVPEDARVRNPSEFRYSYRRYQDSKRETAFPINGMHVIGSDLYPFGNDLTPVGIGIEASFIQRPDVSLMGPLSLSGRGRLWSGRGFDIGYWGVVSLNTLSAEELKNSQFGRDTLSVGLSMRKDLSVFSIENLVGYTFAGTSKQTIGNVDYLYRYGGIVTASIHPALHIGSLRVGGFVEMNLGDDYEISGGSFQNSIGRYRLISGGPEVQYFLNRNVSFGMTGRFVLDATKDADFDMMGNLMGSGVAQGNIAGTVSFYF